MTNKVLLLNNISGERFSTKPTITQIASKKNKKLHWWKNKQSTKFCTRGGFTCL